jgi:hypothetical protein
MVRLSGKVDRGCRSAVESLLRESQSSSGSVRTADGDATLRRLLCRGRSGVVESEAHLEETIGQTTEKNWMRSTLPEEANDSARR